MMTVPCQSASSCPPENGSYRDNPVGIALSVKKALIVKFYNKCSISSRVCRRMLSCIILCMYFAINNLKITSPGYDDIHPKIIKQISMIIAMPLSHIMTCIIIDLYLHCLVSQRFLKK